MSTEHAPAPWRWWDEADGRPPRYDLAKLIGGDGSQVLTLYGGSGDLALGKSPRSIANARLLIRAPSMLRVLEIVLDYWESDPSGFAECEQGCNCIVDQVRAEIAQARGHKAERLIFG